MCTAFLRTLIKTLLIFPHHSLGLAARGFIDCRKLSKGYIKKQQPLRWSAFSAYFVTSCELAMRVCEKLPAPRYALVRLDLKSQAGLLDHVRLAIMMCFRNNIAIFVSCLSQCFFVLLVAYSVRSQRVQCGP